MAKEKELNATELAVMMSGQLRILDAAAKAGEVDDQTLKTSDCIANMIGKTLKSCGLRMAYLEYLKSGGKRITALESGE